jgi:hypothetical protein
MFVFFCTLPDDTEMDVRALDRIMHLTSPLIVLCVKFNVESWSGM